MRHAGFRIEEIGTERHPSLEAAQEAALPDLSNALAQMVRLGLDDGRYVADNGLVRMAEEDRHE